MVSQILEASQKGGGTKQKVIKRKALEYTIFPEYRLSLPGTRDNNVNEAQTGLIMSESEV